jgi:multidrug transporter EmrE-like cation transporter
MSYLYLAATVALTVYGQIVFKWRVGTAGPLPDAWDQKLHFIGRLLLDPWVVSGFASAFLASAFWMLAVSRLDLSHAYPFMSLSFVLVCILAAVLFHEEITTAKAVGLAMIVFGLVIAGRG